MLIRKICILGGTGFVGRVLANRLVRDGMKLRILTRNRERNKNSLILLPGTDLIETDVHNADNLKQQFAGCDAVINLVGILNERGRDGSGFRHVHVELTRKVIEACRATGIRRLLHMSALHANAAHGPSHYLRTKGEAEDLAHLASEQGIHVTSFQPSVIFGTYDSFFNRFAPLLRLWWVFPLPCYGTRMAPVHVGDVAEAMALTLKDPASYGRRYHLCGPHIYSLEDIVRYITHCIGVKCWIIPLNDIFSRIMAAVFDFWPGSKPISTDNYLSAKIDSICDHNDLAQFGITPVPIEAVVPQYLSNSIQRARYYQMRRQSHRNTVA
jgi:nucleoside-diphosphate-sugar epimerase